MAKIGYVRVSTEEQNSDLQHQALEGAGCEAVFSDEGRSGATREREGLSKALEALQAGDTLVVWKIDRLGRSALNNLLLLDELRNRKVEFQSLTEGIDTNTSGGQMMFNIISAFAEQERRNISERTKAGLKSARKRGVKIGRPNAMSSDQIRHAKNLLKSGMNRAEIARNMGVAYTTLRRALLIKKFDE